MYSEKYLVEEQPREIIVYSEISPKKKFVKAFIRDFILIAVAVFGICCINALVEILSRAL
jgi:hypothetical protein